MSSVVEVRANHENSGLPEPGLPTTGENDTLEKEQARELVHQKITERLETLIDAQIDNAVVSTT